MSSLFSKNRIKVALIATVLTITIWAFSAAFQEVLYPVLKGVKWSQAGAKLFIGLGRMFVIYFVKNGVIATAFGGVPLFFAFLGIMEGKGKSRGFSSPVGNLIAAVLLISVLMALLVGASHFTSLISFKYANSYVKALIAITFGVFAGLFILGRQQKKTIS